MNLFEVAIVSGDGRITYKLRDTVRRSSYDAARTLTLRPFSTSIEGIRELLNAGGGNGDDDGEVGAKQTHIE